MGYTGYILSETMRGLRGATRTVFLSTMTMTLSIFVFGTFLLVTMNVTSVVRRLQAKVEIEIFLDDSISPDDKDKLTTTLQGLNTVGEVLFVSKEQALREAAIDTALITAVGSNPLPASIRVRMKEGHRSAPDVEDVLGRVAGLGGIEEISSGRHYARQLDRYILILTLATAAIGIILGLASVLVIANTIQLNIFSRRGSITIMQLVGATDGLIRGPFILEGILQGLLAGGLAVSLLIGLNWSLHQKIPWVLPVETATLLGLIAAGGVLGGLGSSYAMKKSLVHQAPF